MTLNHVGFISAKPDLLSLLVMKTFSVHMALGLMHTLSVSLLSEFCQ